MKGQMSRGLVVVIATWLAFVAGATPAAGQAATNTARIEGRVTDTTGGALPGVAVTISSPAQSTIIVSGRKRALSQGSHCPGAAVSSATGMVSATVRSRLAQGSRRRTGFTSRAAKTQ